MRKINKGYLERKYQIMVSWAEILIFQQMVSEKNLKTVLIMLSLSLNLKEKKRLEYPREESTNLISNLIFRILKLAQK